MKRALRGRQSGVDLKPPQAAVVKSNGGERCGKSWNEIVMRRSAITSSSRATSTRAIPIRRAASSPRACAASATSSCPANEQRTHRDDRAVLITNFGTDFMLPEPEFIAIWRCSRLRTLVRKVGLTNPTQGEDLGNHPSKPSWPIWTCSHNPTHHEGRLRASRAETHPNLA